MIRRVLAAQIAAGLAAVAVADAVPVPTILRFMKAEPSLRPPLHEADARQLEAPVQTEEEATHGATEGVTTEEQVMEWTSEWPTTPGRYWFYGYLFTPDSEQPPTLHTAEVVRIMNGVAYISNWAFLYQSEGASGYWAPMTMPELPEFNL